jgi:hypothetical protein
MIEHPLALGPIALGPIVIGVAIGIVFRVLWVLAREKQRRQQLEPMFRK